MAMERKIRDRSYPDKNDLAVAVYIAVCDGSLEAFIKDHDLQRWEDEDVEKYKTLGKRLLQGFAPSYFAETEHASLTSFEDVTFDFPILYKLARYREARTEMDQKEHDVARENTTFHILELERLRKTGPPRRARKYTYAKELAAIIRDAARLEQYPAEENKLVPSHRKRHPDDVYEVLKTHKILVAEILALSQHKRANMRKWADRYSPRLLSRNRRAR